MLNLETRTSKNQMDTIKNMVERGDIIHSIRHNLDGLWINLEVTDSDGDWIVSIDRTGKVERTQ